jgi:uncharacterized protein YndB with AHSA1/START domain
MSKQATGTLRGNDLTLTRSFKAPIDDVWTSVTKSEHTERWFGKWEGDARPGNTIRIKMVFEKGDAWITATINKCDAPHHLDLTSSSDYGVSHYELKLREDNGTTHLEFTHHLKDRKGVGELGPGWEYYLDMLVHAREGTPKPVWEEYYPALKDEYVARGAAPT